MNHDSKEQREYLKKGDFAALFNDLGWDRHTTPLSVVVADEAFVLSPVAEKRGVQVFSVTGADGRIPLSATRVKIEREATKAAAEHLLIFHDTTFKEQVWQWVAREPRKPAQVRDITLRANQSGDALLQKLDRISFTLSEDESLSIVAVTTRLRDTFDRDKVTKKFFDRFQNEHTAFHGLIAGITTGENDRRWYTSVMINRIMFLYFVQSKRFLDHDTDYLKNHLAGSAKKYGADKFFQSFLCPLFFEGLARRENERTPAIRADLGKLPYLSGSLFVEHEIEARNRTQSPGGDSSLAIDIPDAAFEKLFAFLGEYNWHLDDRPVADGKHINPDVLGYIFEKYINNKQMGAYYTKEDITEYISKNTILPFVLERTREKCEVAFAGEYSVWRLLSEDPDRYIYPAVRKGVELPLPANIEAGVSDVAKRGGWNNAAPESHALPTEIWRETVARRLRYADVRGKLTRGEVTSASDLITLNLDIRQFTQDMVDGSEGAELLRAVWETLNGTKSGTPPLSVLDPTVGSGAFLFAATEILQPIYSGCVDRMRGFVDDADRAGRPNDHKAFRETLAEIQDREKHPNEKYYILKKIITHNLFGVDIMDEATEICKLRLFLKLAAQVEPDDSKENMGIEPLPDIDFNIRAGNTLVGFATQAQMQNAVSGALALDGEDTKWAKFKADLDAYDGLFGAFLDSQEGGTFTSAGAALQKAGLRARLQPLRDQADTLLGHQYGKIGDAAQAAWRGTAKPFHWFVEFYRTLRAGGFDCVIGNPPYVEYRKVESYYQVKNYETSECADLYAFVAERSTMLLRGDGHLGLILPLASVSVIKSGSLRKFAATCFKSLWYSSYGFRPSKLFDGVNLRLSIWLGRKGSDHNDRISTRYQLWSHQERDQLFDLLRYQNKVATSTTMFMKVGDPVTVAINKKMVDKRQLLGTYLTKRSTSVLHYHRSPLYWIRAMDFEPFFKSDTKERSVHHFRDIYGVDIQEGKVIGAILNSTLFYLVFTTTGNCRNLTGEDVESLPIGIPNQTAMLTLASLFDQLMADYSRNSAMTIRYNCQYQTFYPSKSKPIIDEIDRVLAAHYGFTDEELDFIINYDIKYRMGSGADDGDAGNE